MDEFVSCITCPRGNDATQKVGKFANMRRQRRVKRSSRCGLQGCKQKNETVNKTVSAKRRGAFKGWQGAFRPFRKGASLLVALPQSREAFEGWQGAFRQFRTGRKKVCLGGLASLFGSVALPRRCGAFEGWQGAFRQFRKGRKKVCLGSLASLFGSVALPKRRGAFEGVAGCFKSILER